MNAKHNVYSCILFLFLIVFEAESGMRVNGKRARKNSLNK